MPIFPRSSLRSVQCFGKLVHRIFRELAVDPQIVYPGMGFDRVCLHIDGNHGDSSIRRHNTDRVTPAHQRLRRHDKTRYIGHVLRRYSDDGVESGVSDLFYKSGDYLLVHRMKCSLRDYSPGRSSVKRSALQLQLPSSAMTVSG